MNEWWFELAGSPDVMGLVVLIGGVVVASIARLVIARLCKRYTGESRVFTRVVSALAPLTFWVIIAITILMCLRVLGLGTKNDFVDEWLVFLPDLILAVLVLVAGHLFGVGVRELVRRRSTVIQFPAWGAYWLVVGPAILIAMQQFGIDVSFLSDLVLIAFGIAAVTLGLTFVLGARHHAENLIARKELDQYAIGDRIRVLDIEGSVVELRPTGVILATDSGLVTVPAVKFAKVPVTRLTDASE